jgi:uncharacterized Zn-finger protein
VIFADDGIFLGNSNLAFTGTIGMSERNDDPEQFKNPCPVCGKRFKTNSGLWQHKVIHVEAKPFECKFCGKGFKLKGNLRRHMITHYNVDTSDGVVQPNTDSNIDGCTE